MVFMLAIINTAILIMFMIHVMTCASAEFRLGHTSSRFEGDETNIDAFINIYIDRPVHTRVLYLGMYLDIGRKSHVPAVALIFLLRCARIIRINVHVGIDLLLYTCMSRFTHRFRAYM